MKSFYKNIEVNHNNKPITIKTYFYGNPDSKKVIAFSQGLCYIAKLYDKFFKLILNDDVLIITPELNGFNFKNYSKQSILESREIFKKLIEKTAENKEVILTIGHSMGGNICQSVNAKETILINPQMPTSGNMFHLMLNNAKTLYYENSQLKSLKLRLGAAFFFSKLFLLNFRNNVGFIKSVKYMEIEDLFENTNCTLVYGARSKSDGFFDYTNHPFSKEIEIEGTHSSILFNPQRYADAVKTTIE